MQINQPSVQRSDNSDNSQVNENNYMPITSFSHASIFNGRICNVAREVKSIIGGPQSNSDNRSNQRSMSISSQNNQVQPHRFIQRKSEFLPDILNLHQSGDISKQIDMNGLSNSVYQSSSNGIYSCQDRIDKRSRRLSEVQNSDNSGNQIQQLPQQLLECSQIDEKNIELEESHNIVSKAQSIISRHPNPERKLSNPDDYII